MLMRMSVAYKNLVLRELATWPMRCGRTALCRLQEARVSVADRIVLPPCIAHVAKALIAARVLDAWNHTAFAYKHDIGNEAARATAAVIAQNPNLTLKEWVRWPLRTRMSVPELR